MRSCPTPKSPPDDTTGLSARPPEFNGQISQKYSMTFQPQHGIQKINISMIRHTQQIRLYSSRSSVIGGSTYRSRVRGVDKKLPAHLSPARVENGAHH